MSVTQSPIQSKTRILARRSASTFALWGLVGGIFVSGQSWAYVGLVSGLAMIATIEYFQMLRAASVRCFPKFGIISAAIYLACIFWFLLSDAKALPSDFDAFAFFAVIVGCFVIQLREPIDGIDSLLAIAANILGFVYIAFLFSFVSRLIFSIPNPHVIGDRVGDSGAFLLLWLLAVTKFTDMGAYIVGSMIGRHKMIPHISPGKTWEGFVGALIFSQLAACGLYWLFPIQLECLMSWKHVIVLAFILAVLAVLGDLAESVVKRALLAKDSGKLFPGIGGSLDLIDSICFTAPALYFYLKWMLPNAA